MSKYLRQGDQVIAIAGNDKGRSGKILSCREDRVLVEGLNVRKKHVKRTQQGQKETIISREMPFHISNVQLEVGGAPVKLRARFNKKGEKELYYLQGKEEVLHRVVNK